jgi:hypothetical protein
LQAEEKNVKYFERALELVGGEEMGEAVCQFRVREFKHCERVDLFESMLEKHTQFRAHSNALHEERRLERKEI